MSNKCGYCCHLTDSRVEIVCDAIQKQQYAIICVNDTGRLSNWKRAAELVSQSFESILPEKSSFEK